MPYKYEKTPEKVALLKKMRADGAENKDVAVALGITIRKIYDWVREEELPKRVNNNRNFSSSWYRKGKPVKGSRRHDSIKVAKIEVTDEEARALTVREICRAADYGVVFGTKRSSEKPVDRKSLCHFSDAAGNKCNAVREGSSPFCKDHFGHKEAATGYRSCADLGGIPVETSR